MKTYAADLKRARHYLSDHVATSRRSRAFDFRQPGTSNYAYSLTWTGGSLALAGDCGELVITHYDALRHLKSGLRWAAGSDYDYLLSKTSRRQTYDAAATAREIIDALNDRALSALRGHRDEVREWRASRSDYADTEVDWWLSGRPAKPSCRRVDPLSYRSARDRDWMVGDWEAPDGWEMWLRAWGAASTGDPNDIFTHAGRDDIRREIESRCEERGDAISLIQEIGIDDFYGAERWTFRDLLQIECVRKGAREALDVLQMEEFEANPYGWTDTNFWGGTLPPRSAFVDWIALTLVREAGFPDGFVWGRSASGLALEGAERILTEALDAASGGYNQPQHFVHVPGRYGQKGLDWSPEGAARMTIEWLADAYLFWTTDALPGLDDLNEDIINPSNGDAVGRHLEVTP